MALAPQLISPDDLLIMPDSKSYELKAGQLLERHMGAISSWVGGELLGRLRSHCREHQLGLVWPADAGYQCFSHDPSQVRKPDVSFIKGGRLPGNLIPEGWIKITPDLAIEVVSPNDLATELEDKLDDYRTARIPLIWVIYPERRTAWIYRADGSTEHLRESDELSGEQVLPGFRCRLSEIFPPREQPISLIQPLA
jgi:Uma2 family endonuclease